MLETLSSLRPVADPTGPASPTGPDSPAWHLAEIIVVDNDTEPSARQMVRSLVDAGYPHRLRYVHEPRPGLAAARNRAMDEAGDGVLVFIDDDEVAQAGWPDGLITTMISTGAALVGGPVRTHFADRPPAWIVEGGFFDRPEPPDRSPQSWLRSGNLAIDLAQIRRSSLRFDDRFGHSGSEDVAFSRRARELGLGLRWSSSAIVSENVDRERATLRWILTRELNASTNWVRAELLSHPTRARRILIATRGTVRLAQGATLTLAGVVSLRLSRIGRGLHRIARGVGSFRGLLAGASTAYGGAAGRSSGLRRAGVLTAARQRLLSTDPPPTHPRLKGGEP